MTDLTIGAIFDDVQEGLQALQQHIDSLRDNKWFDAANQVQSLREENRQLKAQLAALKPATESPNPERSQLEALGKPRLRWVEEQVEDGMWWSCYDADGQKQGVAGHPFDNGFTWDDYCAETWGVAPTLDEAKAACEFAILARLEGK